MLETQIIVFCLLLLPFFFSFFLRRLKFIRLTYCDNGHCDGDDNNCNGGDDEPLFSNISTIHRGYSSFWSEYEFYFIELSENFLYFMSAEGTNEIYIFSLHEMK